MEDLYALKEDFLNTWPIERVRNMELEEYTNLNRSDSFCYWVQNKLEKLGGVKGGEGKKFGIYEREEKDNIRDSGGLASDERYTWQTRFGDNRNAAYLKVRSLIVEIIEFAKQGNVVAIEKVAFAETIRWKIAFLYNDYKILNIFKFEALELIAKQLGIDAPPRVTFGQLQAEILSHKPADEDFYAFSGKLWDSYDKKNSERRYWLFVPGEDGVNWQNCLQRQTMALSWMKLPPLTSFGDKIELLDALKEVYPNGGTSPTQGASMLWDFVHKVKKGDYVIAKKGRKTLLGYGEVTSDYFEDTQLPEFGQLRSVKWLKNGQWIINNRSFPIKTLTKINYFDELIKTMENEHVNTDEVESSVIMDLLNYKKQIILQGAPGTGKTKLAKELAAEVLGLGSIEELKAHPRFKLVQFHPSYSYEDFVKGIVASPVSDGTGLQFKVQNKVFADFALTAHGSPDKFVMIIDEINRANLSAVLGELIYSLEYRGEALDGIYDYSDGATGEEKKVLVPENLLIIGTMNTADRSVGVIDYAIRRRFAFVDILPINLANENEFNGEFNEGLFSEVSKLFVKDFDLSKDYNSGLEPLERSDFLSEEFHPKDVWLGHSYFIDKSSSKGDMEIRLEYEIKPILREYVRDGILKTEALKMIEGLKVE